MWRSSDDSVFWNTGISNSNNRLEYSQSQIVFKGMKLFCSLATVLEEKWKEMRHWEDRAEQKKFPQQKQYNTTDIFVSVY